MTVFFSMSIPAGSVGVCSGAPHIQTISSSPTRSGGLLDGDTDERAVFGPRAVVVLDVLVAEQLVQRKPRVARTLADAAVGDGVAAVVEPLADVQLPELVVGLERAVLVGRLRPGHVERGRDVAAPLALLLRQVRRREQLAGELVGGPDVDQVLLADRVDDLVAERADRDVLVLGLVAGLLARHGVLREVAAVELPLLAAAVEQLHRLVAVELEVPIGVGGEPVVVAAVEDNGVVVADALVRQQGLELLLADEVAADLVLQFRLPVQLDGAWEVAAVVGGDVFVDLDEHDPGGVQVFLGPIGRDEHVSAAHAVLLRWMCGCAKRGGSLPGTGGRRRPPGPEARMGERVVRPGRSAAATEAAAHTAQVDRAAGREHRARRHAHGRAQLRSHGGESNRTARASANHSAHRTGRSSCVVGRKTTASAEPSTTRPLGLGRNSSSRSPQGSGGSGIGTSSVGMSWLSRRPGRVRPATERPRTRSHTAPPGRRVRTASPPTRASWLMPGT